MEDERLQGADLPDDSRVWDHDASEGTCRMPPTRGVLLAVCNEQGLAVLFGFLQFPEVVRDTRRRVVAETGLKGCWAFGGHVESGDERYRKIVRQFAAAGFLAEELDEFAAA